MYNNNPFQEYITNRIKLMECHVDTSHKYVDFNLSMSIWYDLKFSSLLFFGKKKITHNSLNIFKLFIYL